MSRASRGRRRGGGKKGTGAITRTEKHREQGHPKFGIPALTSRRQANADVANVLTLDTRPVFRNGFERAAEESGFPAGAEFSKKGTGGITALFK
jgi:hypothetical protein